MDIYYHLYPIVIFALLAVWCAMYRRHKKSQQGLPPVYSALVLIALGIFGLYIPFYWEYVDVCGAFADAVTPLSVIGLLRAGGAFLSAVLMTVLEILRHFALALEYEPINVTISETVTIERYYLAHVVLWVLAAMGTASVVFLLARSLLKGAALKYSRKRPVYYFSSLNEKSFTLASSLHEQAKKKPKREQPFLVFCQVDVGDESNTELQFSADAERLGAIFEKDPVHAIRIKDPLRQQVKIFLIDEKEDDNILSLLRMEESICPMTPGKGHPSSGGIPQSDIYIFSTLESTELIFDKTLQRFQEQISEQGRIPRFNLHLLDETRLIVQKLLLEHPLYEPLFYVPAYDGTTQQDPDADRDGHISVLAIGGGLLGMELVRGAMICGVTDSYTFDIQVIDRNARELEKQFRYFSSYKDYFDPASSQEGSQDGAKKPGRIKLPDIIGGEDGIGASIKPVFHEADCRSTDFEEILEKHCKHCNYIVIATGDDELNISTARFLQRWYARQDIMRRVVPSRPPMIFAAIRNSERYEALHRLEDESASNSISKQLFLFGNNEDIFSADCILSRPLDASAALFNCCYRYFDGDKLHIPSLCTPMDQRREMQHQVSQLPQVQQFSNQAVALHSLYKLQDLFFLNGMPKALLQYRYDPEPTLAATEFLVHSMAKMIKDRGEKFSRLEHRRWNLFQLLDGWECFPMEMIPECVKQGYSAKKKPHQLPLIKLHGCLVPFDDLDELSVLCGKDPQAFKGYDACMCTASIFAWLDLEADQKHAKSIRSKLLEAAKEKWNADVLVCTCEELLDLIIETFDPALQGSAAAK